MSIRNRLSRRKSSYNTPRRTYVKAARTTKGRRRATERKNVDTTWDALVGDDMSSYAGGTGNAYTVLLNGIAANATSTGRIGRKAVLKDILLSFGIQPSSSTSPTRLHVAIVSDNAPTGTLPSANLLYDAYGLRELDYTPRFRIHMKKTYQFKPTMVSTTAVDAPARFVGPRRVPLKIIETFSGDDATLGSISGKAVYLVAWSEDSVDCAFEGKARLRFTEE